MSTEAVAAFAERLKTDEAFARKLADAASREERRALAREAGYDLSADDLPAIRSALGVGELSDEDLERIAGGAGGTTVALTVGASIGGVISLAAGAAAAL